MNIPKILEDNSSLGHLPWCLSGKEPACQCRRCKRCGFNPWVEKIPGEENGNPLQYPCLENAMDRGAWRAPTGHE